MSLFNIEVRKLVFVNTDSQRRCYNGAYFSYKYEWDYWDWIELDVEEHRVEDRLRFWRELNDYAVNQRGLGAKKEFRKVKVNNYG